VIIEVRCKAGTILRLDLWYLIFLSLLRESIVVAGEQIEVFADGKLIEKPDWWDDES